MATFFGEVILPSSRAFFDDFDDNDEPEVSDRQDLVLNVLSTREEPFYDALIITDGSVVSGFAHHYMRQKDDELLAEIKIGKEKNEDSSDILILKVKEAESAKLQLLANKRLLLQIPSTIDLITANQLCLHIIPWLKKCKRVVTITSKHVSAYSCDSISKLPSAFIRGLATSSQQLPPSIHHLETPNFISGVPASVLSLCEAMGIPGLMIILFSESNILDTQLATLLLKGFKDSDLSTLLVHQHETLNFTDHLRNTDKSFMYM